jgi:hypothetical protein
MARRKNLVWTPDELEHLSLHELGELLANVVMVLRRLPDVPVSDLVDRPAKDVASMVARVRHEQQNNSSGEAQEGLPDWAEGEKQE